MFASFCHPRFGQRSKPKWLLFGASSVSRLVRVCLRKKLRRCDPISKVIKNEPYNLAIVIILTIVITLW